MLEVNVRYMREVIFHKRGRVFHQGFQTRGNCLEILMKHEARVYEMASQKGLIY